MSDSEFVLATSLTTLREQACISLQVAGHTVALYAVGEKVYAVDNRCPHMGFPLDRGTVQDGILTCHWHHARFDLESGGTFDQWADDVRSFPVEIRGDDVWVDVAQHSDPRVRQRERLQVGLERNLSLVIGKAVLVLLEGREEAIEPFAIGLQFGTSYRQAGWGQGLTILTCLMNILPHLQREVWPRALYHGLSAVAMDCAGEAPRFAIRPLPDNTRDIPTLKRWFRRFVEVRDAEGAERCIVSAIRAGANDKAMADMLFAAVTDHRYIQIGHVADFTNKALEALDIVGWGYAEPVLTSLARGYATATRMEESNAWRNPIDLVALLEEAFTELPQALATGAQQTEAWQERETLVPILLGDDPQAIVAALLAALTEGATMVALAGVVAYTAALRIGRFHTSNEFDDWDTALHTFTFANAVHQGLQRAASVELLRGVFDAAMSIYLDRFLNIPAARLPQANGTSPEPAALLEALPDMLNRQQQVNEAGEQVGHYLFSQGDPEALLAQLGALLLREDRDFHTIQTIEAAFRQYTLLQGQAEAVHVLVAAARYLAAHAPTVRAQGQTYQIAQRLHRGDLLFVD